MRTFVRHASVALSACAFTLLGLACGSRTGLLADGPDETELEREPRESVVPRLDAGLYDARETPGLDARPDVEVDQRDCKDPAETLVYVITTAGDLYAFDPRSSSFRFIGPILCPTVFGGTPFSMAVDRQGVAYVVFNTGELFRVSTRTAACAATDLEPGQDGVTTFGMSFASDQGGPDETLYIATSEFLNNNTGNSELGRIDIPAFDVSLVGPFAPRIFGAELTGTGDGRLFAFYTRGSGSDSFIAQVDKDTAEVIAEARLTGLDQGDGWAFSFWGGDFYTFTAPAGSTVVTRYRPSDDSLVEVAQLPGALVVGAGASTCAPVE